ncbi:hypothetical protein SKAU_G00343260 [Synaphobranchus kaupii]|uniref:Uncharacterized protein n=1 Tax=Synaphobranchus kaupii TaxID=118154 RepID=A0A9Q1EJ45_SYNKA|nr:hypothetical protein SKAU_G00343260 [Synaphobranchus kaupii]
MDLRHRQGNGHRSVSEALKPTRGMHRTRRRWEARYCSGGGICRKESSQWKKPLPNSLPPSSGLTSELQPERTETHNTRKRFLKSDASGLHLWTAHGLCR